MSKEMITRNGALGAALALPLLLVGLNWGLPRAVNSQTVDPWGYDELAPLSPLIEARSRFSRPESGYLAYPVFQYAVLTVSYSPYLACSMLFDHFRPAAKFPYGMSDPLAMCRNLTLIARFVSVAMALGILLTVYDITKLLFDRLSALWASAMTSVLPTFVYYGKTSNLDIPYIFWLMLSSRSLVRIFQGGDRRDYIAIGVYSALAICTKDQAVGYLVCFPVLLAVHRWREAGMLGGYRSRLWTSVFGGPMRLGLLASLVTFCLANNLVFGAPGFFRHVRFATRMAQDYRMFPPGAAGQFGLAVLSFEQVALTLGPALAFSVVGIARLAAQRRWETIGFSLAPIISYYTLIVSRVGYSYPRFHIATAIYLIIIGAGAVRFAAGSRSARLTGVLSAVCLIYGVVMSAGVDLAMTFDARCAAEDWVRNHVRPGSRFEAYVTHQNLLPRVWDRYRVELVSVQAMTGPALRSRAPDYIIITDLQDASRRHHPSAGPFLRGLADGSLGYSKNADFENKIGIARLFNNCICNKLIVYKRLSTSQDVP